MALQGETQAPRKYQTHRSLPAAFLCRESPWVLSCSVLRGGSLCLSVRHTHRYQSLNFFWASTTFVTCHYLNTSPLTKSQWDFLHFNVRALQCEAEVPYFVQYAIEKDSFLFFGSRWKRLGNNSCCQNNRNCYAHILPKESAKHHDYVTWHLQYWWICLSRLLNTHSCCLIQAIVQWWIIEKLRILKVQCVRIFAWLLTSWPLPIAVQIYHCLKCNTNTSGVVLLPVHTANWANWANWVANGS